MSARNNIMDAVINVIIIYLTVVVVLFLIILPILFLVVRCVYYYFRKLVAEFHVSPNNSTRHDRQGNVFTIHDENNQVNRYNDIFYIETNNADAARARAQLEKDDKDLPTYEEVMRITSAANSASTSIMAATSTSSVNTTNTIDSTLALPPYSAIFCNDRTGAVNSCERSAALSSPNVASTSTEHTTIALSSSLGFSNTISTQTQTAAPPSSSSNV
ncbi:uncharacterized protein ACN427_002381 isoform 6-T6 [Glossina fuscipes fuscipes]